MILIGTPYKTLINTGLTCKYFAASNQILFPIRRIDNQFIAIVDDGAGFAKMTLTTSPPAGAALGQKIYIYTLGSVGSGVFTITAISGSDITTDMPFTVTSAGGMNFLEAKERYLILAQYSKVDPATGNLISLGSQKFRPFSDGYIEADVSRYARQCVKSDYSWTNELTVNFQDTNLSGQLVVTFTESWEGSSEAASSPYYVYAINGIMKVGVRLWNSVTGVWDNFGGNMADYMTEPSGDDLAKWLTPVRSPKYWRGLPFSLDFIFSPEINAAVLSKKETLLDINGATISTASEGLSATRGGFTTYPYANTVGIIQSAPGRTPYASNVKSIAVEIINSVGTVDIMKTITVRVDDCTPESPVYLAALGKTGWVYYCFGPKSTRNITANNGTLFSKWYSDQSSQRSTVEVLNKDNKPELIVGADGLDMFDMEIFSEIITSSKVLMLMNPDTWMTEADSGDYQLPVWNTVKIRSGKYPSSVSPGPYNTVELTLEEDEIETQQQ